MKKNPTYTPLFGTIRLLIFRKNSHLYVYSRLYFYSFLYFYCYRKAIVATFFMNSTIICDPNPMHYEFWWEIGKNSSIFVMQLTWSYSLLQKFPTYTFIQSYTFISFPENFLPIRLFSPILLLIFKEISHLFFYSDSSSIRNSRVGLVRNISAGSVTLSTLEFRIDDESE